MVKSVPALLALFVTGCGPDAILPHPPPVVIAYALVPGEEVVCVETLTRLMGFPFFPLIGWAKRTFSCEVVRRGN